MTPEYVIAREHSDECPQVIVFTRKQDAPTWRPVRPFLGETVEESLDMAREWIRQQGPRHDS